MCIVVDKFPSENPYALSQQLIAARSNTVTDLNVILVESSQVRSTNAFLASQALTNNPANPVSAVTTVGQQVIGAGVGDGTIAPDGGVPCFIGTTAIATLGGDRFIEDVTPGDMVMAFDPQGAVKAFRVTDKFIHLVDKFTQVSFADGRVTGLIDSHRYWQGAKNFAPISDIDSVRHWNGEWTDVDIVGRADTEGEVLVYNLTVETVHTYFANGDAVSNIKPNQEPGGGF